MVITLVFAVYWTISQLRQLPPAGTVEPDAAKAEGKEELATDTSDDGATKPPPTKPAAKATPISDGEPVAQPAPAAQDGGASGGAFATKTPIETLLKASVAGNPVVLTPATVPDYVRGLPLQGAFEPGEELECMEIGGGNLNYAFVLKGAASDKSCFVKQAPDFIKCLGEDAKLTTERVRFEADALLEFNKIAPGLTPELYYYDATNCAMVMENMASHKMLQDTLIGGDVSNGPAVKAAAFAAKVHAATHASAINGHMRDVYKERFNNPALCDITNT